VTPPQVDPYDLGWLLLNTVPAPGERAAVLESWTNVLLQAGVARSDVEEMLDRAERHWRCFPFHHTDDCLVGGGGT